MSKEWSDFDKFCGELEDKYLPRRGEGDTIATQITTAVSKLVYKWFNDGDVVDNTNGLDGWCNDLSSYGNWLYKYCPEARAIFDKWWFNRTSLIDDSDYEDMLYELCERTQDMDYLDTLNEVDAIGSIYECDGPFVFQEDDDYCDWE